MTVQLILSERNKHLLQSYSKNEFDNSIQEVNSVKSDHINGQFIFHYGYPEKKVNRFIVSVLFDENYSTLTIIESKNFSKLRLTIVLA